MRNEPKYEATVGARCQVLGVSEETEGACVVLGRRQEFPTALLTADDLMGRNSRKEYFDFRISSFDFPVSNFQFRVSNFDFRISRFPFPVSSYNRGPLSSNDNHYDFSKAFRHSSLTLLRICFAELRGAANAGGSREGGKGSARPRHHDRHAR